jgi:hypothetical protein
LKEVNCFSFAIYEGTLAASANDGVSGVAADKKDDGKGNYVGPGHGPTT